MKNREKYREQILEWAVVPGRDMCDFKRKEVLPHFGKGSCACISCPWCSIMLNLWLDEEYTEPPKPEVDWDNVPVDTLVRVRNSKNENWKLRHFKRIRDTTESQKFETWGERQTSRTTDGNISLWRYCESVEDEEDGSN